MYLLFFRKFEKFFINLEFFINIKKNKFKFLLLNINYILYIFYFLYGSNLFC